MLWLALLCSVLAGTVVALCIKLALIRKGADEIAVELQNKLEHDTNTLITISTADRHMRRLAANINAQLRLLRQERHRFQQGDLELREAVTNISHDLRTPLTAICGYLDLLEQEKTSEEITRYIRMIRGRSEALKQLTEELVRYSVIASSTEAGDLQKVSLGSALEDCLAEHYAALTGRGITPEVYLPEQPVYRQLDKMALSRILSNIVSNAVKYSDGDLVITLHANGELVFSNAAQDLTPVTVGRLFDRFFTLETGRGGAGLGLSIAKLLTEQMGGSIGAEYANGRLSVRVRL